ncbi:hypothetical protein [Frankia sp. QA3]|uniref:hypothetical protein n=1 Tax=Frankia sp. QA3 TaxID=710111 RepID=UPI00030B5B71|nr:hypothetical protein [Frankia sp. QA3]
MGGRPATTVDEAGLSDTDLDHHSSKFREHNYEIMTDLQSRCPVAKPSAWGGYWLFTSYEAVFDSCRDSDLFSNHMSKAIPALPVEVSFVPIDIDPPMPQKYWKLLLPHLSPKAAEQREPALRRTANELIDAFVESREGDLAEQLFPPLPARWTLQLLDFDESRWPDWIDWLHFLIHDRA